jgi:hypothetical protein
MMPMCRGIGLSSRLRHITGVFLETALTDSGWRMLGNALGAVVALLGLFGVGAVICAMVWTLFAWSGRWYDWLLSYVTPLGLASITTCAGWLLGWI